MIADTSSEPKQPRRFEKKRNIPRECPLRRRANRSAVLYPAASALRSPRSAHSENAAGSAIAIASAAHTAKS